MASKYLIGLLVGFFLAGGATLFSYAEDLDLDFEGITGVNGTGVNGTGVNGTGFDILVERVAEKVAEILAEKVAEPITETIIPEKEVFIYRDCSVFDFKELTAEQRRGLSEPEIKKYYQEKQQSFENQMQCGRYNNEIATAENDKRLIEERKEISRGF